MKSLDAVAWTGGRVLFTDAFPPGSPTHVEVPYAFKLYAILEAKRRGFDSVLWLDSVCVAEKPVGPVFERIERDGYLLVTGGDVLGHWSNDACLGAFGFTRDQAMRLAMFNGTFFGLDFRNALARSWFDELRAGCERGLFLGPYLSLHAPAEIRAAKRDKPIGFVSNDPRVWGHRHDEAVGSALAHRLGLKISTQGELLDAGNSPTAVIRHRS